MSEDKNAIITLRQAVKLGAGALAMPTVLRSGSALAADDVAGQTRSCLAHIAAIVEEAVGSMRDATNARPYASSIAATSSFVLPKSSNSKSTVPSIRVDTLRMSFSESSGRLWMATFSGGLKRLTGTEASPRAPSAA